MKAVDLYSKVRRDPLTGNTPHHHCANANRKFRWNVFASVNVKNPNERGVDYLVMEENGDAYFFRAFVLHLLET